MAGVWETRTIGSGLRGHSDDEIRPPKPDNRPEMCQNIWALCGKLTRPIILVITFDILMSYLQINILYSYPVISLHLDLVHTHPSFMVTQSNMVHEF